MQITFLRKKEIILYVRQKLHGLGKMIKGIKTLKVKTQNLTCWQTKNY